MSDKPYLKLILGIVIGTIIFAAIIYAFYSMLGFW
jgi:hypothetical protein